MKALEPLQLSARWRIGFALVALAASLLTLFATQRYGAGLSPDSVGYIGIARNLVSGNGLREYSGKPLIIWPPLYPIVLASYSWIFGIDPILSSRTLNALLFGLITYASGIVFCRYLSRSRSLVLLGAFSVVISTLFRVSVMAWSEPLFVLFTVIFLSQARPYLANRNVASLILLSLAAALAALTRYAGGTLILSGVGLVLLSQARDLKTKIWHLAVFAAISAAPLAAWLARNYVLSGTLTGPRAPSSYSLSQNLKFAFDTLISWYIPAWINEHRSILLLIGLASGYVVGIRYEGRWKAIASPLFQTAPAGLFVAIYVAFLIFSATSVAFDQINDRLLSPVYIPLTVVFLTILESLFPSHGDQSIYHIDSVILIMVVSIWSLFPCRAVISDALNRAENGAGGYNSKIWRESELLQYIKEHRLPEESTVYSNAPDALYILADLESQMTPSRTAYNSSQPARDVRTLEGSWPEEERAYIVWFDHKIRPYLFTMDELATIANIRTIAQFGDGAIFVVSRRI